MSSAGSGKTYTLAREYIKLVLQNPDNYRHVLAVTFTNKATAEMKERIIDFLTALSRGEDDELEAQYLSEGFKSKELVRKRAKMALNKMLHDYSRFSVFTIDSFFNRILRAFAVEMQLPMRMEVELDVDKVLDFAYDKLMETLSEDGEMRRWLTTYMMERLEDEKGWNIEYAVKELGENLFSESFQLMLSEAKIERPGLKTLIRELNHIASQFEMEAAKIGKVGIEIMSRNGFSHSDFKGGYPLTLAFDQAQQGRSVLVSDSVGKRLQKNYKEEGDWLTKANLKKPELLSIVPDLQDVFQKLNLHFEKNFPLYVSATEVLKNIRAFGAILGLRDMIRDYRNEEDKILISDQGPMIRGILEEVGMEFIFEKIGMQYQHLLIDEFQDTSALQWLNFKPLADNMLAEGHEVLLVGDPKQSVYRFRDGEVELILAGAEISLGYEAKQEILSTNYRSYPAIIDFNNLFFQDIGEDFELDDPKVQLLLNRAYKDATQQAPGHKENGGYVHIEVLTKEEVDKEEEKAKDIINQLLPKQLKRLEDKGFKPGQIAFLVDSQKEANTLSQFLMERDWKVQSSDALLLNQSAVIKCLMSVVTFLCYPHKAGIRGQMTQDLLQFGLIELDAHEAFSRASDHDAKAFLAILPGIINSLYLEPGSQSIYSILNELIHELGFQEKELAFSNSLLNMALEFEQNVGNDLMAFCEFFEEEAERVKVEMAVREDAYVIMTLHKSKGLQFPVVFIPYLSRSLKPQAKSKLWLRSETPPFDKFPMVPVAPTSLSRKSLFSEDILAEDSWSFFDALNLLYVGFTRAEQALYIYPNESNAATKEGDGKNLSYVFLERLQRMKPSLKSTSENSYSYGDFEALFPDSKRKKEEKSQIEMPQQKGNSTDRIKIRRPLNAVIHSDEIARGLLLHEILEKIHHSGELEQVLSEMQVNGRIRSAQLPELKDQIRQITDLNELRDFFQAKETVLIESEILTEEGILRPDRVLIQHENEASILDFKTGLERDSDKRQIKRYADALEKMGYTVKHSYLLYTRDLQLIDA